MLPLALPGSGSLEVVCLGAHCDDIEIGCGGALVALAEARPEARFHCWVFSGSGERARESQACLSQLVGAQRLSLQVFDHRDGYFPAEWAQIKERLSGLSRSVRADIVFTHTRDDSHQDHRTLAELTWNHFRRDLVLEYEIVKYEGDLARANCYIPLSAAQLQRKTDALMAAFATQADKGWFTRSTFEAIARLRGIEANAASGYAEGFFARKLVLDAGAGDRPGS